MANTAYYSKSVGNVESVFFVAKDNSKGQEKVLDIQLIVFSYFNIPLLLKIIETF